MDLNEATTLARVLMDEHGLHDWRLVLDRARTRAGVCRAGSKEIGLSGPLTALHAEAEVRDTVLHEIAHALVGPRHGHDAVWRAKALALGCSAQRCVPADAPKVPGRWVGRCPAGHTSTRHRRPERVQSCSRCSPTFDPLHLVEWRRDGQVVAMSPTYDAELRRVRRHADDREAARAQERTLGPRVPVRLGSAVVLGGRGRYAGLPGIVIKRGRTRWHVQTVRGLVAAPFDLVLDVSDPRVVVPPTQSETPPSA